VDADDLTLDGNAVAGLLRELFADDMTAAVGCCDGCGAVEAVGALVVYAHAPGVVVRCPHCASVLLRVVRAEDRAWLDVRGVRWLEVRT
jgi:hypothetical protein